MAKTSASSSSSNKDKGSPLARSQHVSPGSQSFSGAVEVGTSFIKPAAIIDEGRKEVWQDARGFASAVSSNASSSRQSCHTEHHDNWLKHRTFAALKVEIDDSPLVSCVRCSENVKATPSAANVLSVIEDCNRLSSSSGQCNIERSRKVDEASVSSFEYHQVAPQQKTLSQANLWQELRVVGSCDSSRGSVMNSAPQNQQQPSSAKASTSSFQDITRCHPQSPAKPPCSNQYYRKMVPSSSLPTSDSDGSGDRKHLAARLSKLNNRLKGGGISIDVSDSSPPTDVASMKSLIERQRQSYIRRLKREIQWLEKVEKLLLEAQGRKRDSAFAKRAAEIAQRPVGLQADDCSCHACRKVNPVTAADLLEQSASVYNSPLFVRCDFLRKFHSGDNDENFQPVYSDKEHCIVPRDLFKPSKSGCHRTLETNVTESAMQSESAKLCKNGTGDVHHPLMTPAHSSYNGRYVHYSDNTDNHMVTLSYQHLTNGETTLENGKSSERASKKASKPILTSPTSSNAELTSTPYNCEVCRHRCPCSMKLGGIPVDSVSSNLRVDISAGKSCPKNINSPSWQQTSNYPTTFSTNKARTNFDQERAFVSIPITGSPRLVEDKINLLSSTKRLRASPRTNMTPATQVYRKIENDIPADKPKMIRTQRISKNGVAWYVPVHDAKPWLQHRGCGDGSIADVENIRGQNEMDDGLTRSVEELTLQDAFRCYKSAFILSSQARVKKVKMAARQRRHRVQSRAVALSRNRPFIATMPSAFIDQLHRPYKRSFSHQEMRIQTERIYRTLPEFQEQIDYKRRKEAYRTNRLLADIYKNKILQKTLSGKVSYAITEKLL